MILPSQLSASKSSASYSTSYVNQQQVNYGYSQKVIPKGAGGFGGLGAPNYSVRGASSSFQIKRPAYGVPAPPPPPNRQFRPHVLSGSHQPLSASLPRLTTAAYYQTASFAPTITTVSIERK